MEVIMKYSNKLTKRELVWVKASSLARSIISLSETLPENQIYQLNMRLKNSAVSVPVNIVEGFSKIKKIDKIRSFIKANGTLAECRDYLSLVQQLKYGNTNHLIAQIDELAVLLNEDIHRAARV
jgi:four helix bundle protein